MNILNFLKRNRLRKSKLVSVKIDEIETEMKKIGFWDNNPPDFNCGSYVEAPSFELWLQCVFIPNARRAAQKGKYPTDSQVGVMAMRQYDYHSHVAKAQNLFQLLSEFDALIKEK